VEQHFSKEVMVAGYERAFDRALSFATPRAAATPSR
jgi:hypothetical protein